MKITLIYPGITGIGFNSLGKGGHDTTWINLGLAYISSFLKENKIEVNLIDLRNMKDWNEVNFEIKKRNSDIYGIHFNTVNFNNALMCAKFAKNIGRTVVAGGPHATLSPQEILNTGFIDFVFVGEGEISFLKFINSISSDRIVMGERIENLDSLPFPDRDLYNIRKIIDSPFVFPFPENGLTLMASRGCPYNCSFCQPIVEKIFGKKIRYRSVENVIEEIKYLINKHQVKYIHFDDDTFTTRKSWVLEFCDRLLGNGIKILWSAQSRSNTFDEEIAKSMSKAGCFCLFFGFESGSQRVLDILKKGITYQQSLEAAKLCKKYKILIFANYMLGNPTETLSDLKETLIMIKKIKPEIHSPSYFTPIPGSNLYKFCQDNNLLLIDSYEDFIRNPISAKIKGIDYNILNSFKNKILKFSPKWFSERYFAKIVLTRWRNLIKKKYYKLLLSEIIFSSFISKNSLKNLILKFKFGKKLINRYKREIYSKEM